MGEYLQLMYTAKSFGTELINSALWLQNAKPEFEYFSSYTLTLSYGLYKSSFPVISVTIQFMNEWNEFALHHISSQNYSTWKVTVYIYISMTYNSLLFV